MQDVAPHNRQPISLSQSGARSVSIDDDERTLSCQAGSKRPTHAAVPDNGERSRRDLRAQSGAPIRCARKKAGHQYRAHHSEDQNRDILLRQYGCVRGVRHDKGELTRICEHQAQSQRGAPGKACVSAEQRERSELQHKDASEHDEQKGGLLRRDLRTEQEPHGYEEDGRKYVAQTGRFKQGLATIPGLAHQKSRQEGPERRRQTEPGGSGGCAANPGESGHQEELSVNTSGQRPHRKP